MTFMRLEHPQAEISSEHPTFSVKTDSDADRRKLVHRIIQSPTFGRCERLSALLTFICEMALKGREADINEQRIGREVFGRSEHYDPSVDGIVRSQASRLRRRLEMYFEQEGANEPLQILIPRGGYVPVFRSQGSSRVSPAEPISAPSGFPSPLGEQTNSLHLGDFFPRRWPQWGLSFVLGILLIAIMIHDRQRQGASVVAASTHPFWSHIFTKGQLTTVVAPDSGLVLFHSLSGQGVDLKQYLDGGYRTQPNGASQISPAQKSQLLSLANSRYTSMADVDAILNLKDRARILGSEVSVRYARDLRPNDFKTGTVVLLGASSADPWVELFEQNMNFVLTDNFAGSIAVLNRSPQKGEPAQWQFVNTDPQRRVFAIVAYLSNLSGDGNALVIEGTTVAGTEAAADFVNDDAQLLPFLNRIRQADGSLPHFELLLEAHNLSASAVQSQILAWRTKN
ncbi:MAG TPA: hypothetical protein VGR47_06840 [Terracidiphilus sp.]|nr:hypothetical protein [Terracidiphilus sp.]